MIFRLLACVLFSVAGHGRGDSVSVSAAISLREPLREIAAEYQRGTGVHVELNFGASGQLMAQIREGAPVDLFIAAAQKQVDELIGQKLLDPATRAIVARNRLVLIVPTDAKSPPAGFADLSDARFNRIAIGEPKTVPAGEYASQLFRTLKLMDVLRDRLVYGSNVRQVLSYVERGEVDAGIVYETDARVSAEKVRIVAKADEAWHEPIVYPAGVVSASEKRETAAAFLKYVESERGQRILSHWGFLAPTTQSSR